MNRFLLGSSGIIAVMRAVVLPAALEGDGKCAGWTVFTKPHLGQRGATVLPGFPCLYERGPPSSPPPSTKIRYSPGVPGVKYPVQRADTSFWFTPSPAARSKLMC